jgi:ferredoxin
VNDVANTARAIVDKALCEGHALCLVYAPDVFDIGDDETAYVTVDEITDEQMSGVREAVAQCPMQAIRIELGPGGGD